MKIRYFLANHKKHLLMLFIPLLISFSIFILLQKNKVTLPQNPLSVQQEQYTFTTLTTQKITPQIDTYGTLTAATTWDALSQVDGTLVYLNPQLKAGYVIKKGELLWRLESSLQLLEVQRSRSEVKRIQTEIDQLQQQLHNEKKLLRLEKQSLYLAQKSMNRNSRLQSEGAVTLARREQEESTLLSKQYQVQVLENSMSTLPLKIKTLLSAKKTAETIHQHAKIQLSYYEVKAPLQGFVGDIKLSQGQFITARQRLFQLYGGDTLEVEAQLSSKQFKQLFNGAFKADGVTAYIQHPDGDKPALAKVMGLREKVSDDTQHLAVVLHLPRQRTALLRQGSFVNITLTSAKSHEVLLLPSQAIRTNGVYLLSPQNKIEFKQVEVGETHGEDVIINAGLKIGDRILTSEHTLIVEGLKIEPDQMKP